MIVHPKFTRDAQKLSMSSYYYIFPPYLHHIFPIFSPYISPYNPIYSPQISPNVRHVFHIFTIHFPMFSICFRHVFPMFPHVFHRFPIGFPCPAASCRADPLAPGAAGTRRRPAARMPGLGVALGAVGPNGEMDKKYHVI